MKTTANKKTVKALLSQAGSIRAQWAVRGVAEGEFEQVKALEQKAWELSPKSAETVDSLYR
jgi:hypothetical protein